MQRWVVLKSFYYLLRCSTIKAGIGREGKKNSKSTLRTERLKKQSYKGKKRKKEGEGKKKSEKTKYVCTYSEQRRVEVEA